MKLRINEGFDPSIPDWLRKDLSNMSQYSRIVPSDVKYADRQIPTTSREFNKYKEISEDPNGNDIYVLHYVNPDTNDDTVWIFGHGAGTVRHPISRKTVYLSELPPKYIIPNIVDFGRLYGALDRQKIRKDRSMNQPPKEFTRVPDKDRYWSNERYLDKSGYWLPDYKLDKYRAKLGRMKLEKQADILADANATYGYLTGLYPALTGKDIPFIVKSNYKSLRQSMSNLFNIFIDDIMQAEEYPSEGIYRTIYDMSRKLKKQSDLASRFYDAVEAQDWESIKNMVF